MKKELKNYIDFLLVMTEKEIRIRYKRHFLGFIWIILSPLLQMVIIGFIFSFFIKVPNYYLFLLSGLLPWTFFSQSLNRTTTSIVSERHLLQKAKFSVEVIPLSIVLSGLINLVISLGLLVTFLLITKTAILINLFILFPSLIWLLVLTTGFSLITSTLYVQYRDFGFIIRTFLTLGFYATPVIYHLALIPERLRVLFALNPLSSIIELFHLSLLSQGAIYRPILLINLVVTVLLLFLGMFIYVKKRNYLVDWL